MEREKYARLVTEMVASGIRDVGLARSILEGQGVVPGLSARAPSATYHSWMNLLDAQPVPQTGILDYAQDMGWAEPNSIGYLARVEFPSRTMFLMQDISGVVQLYVYSALNQCWVTGDLPDLDVDDTEPKL